MTKNGKPWIKVAKLEPQKEPRFLTALNAEVGRRWGQLFLLDVLKEAALRIGFPNLFKSPALYETLPRDILQMRFSVRTRHEHRAQTGCLRNCGEIP